MIIATEFYLLYKISTKQQKIVCEEIGLKRKKEKVNYKPEYVYTKDQIRLILNHLGFSIVKKNGRDVWTKQTYPVSDVVDKR